VPFIFRRTAMLQSLWLLSIPLETILDRTSAKRVTALRKHVSISAMKHPKQNKRAPQTHPSALAVPSYHRILVKHGLIEKTLPIPEAYEVFLKVGADPEVQKLRRKVARGNKMKHVPALYLATAMALQGMTRQELEALKLRIEEKRV
jgi:hypothetical protein